MGNWITSILTGEEMNQDTTTAAEKAANELEASGIKIDWISKKSLMKRACLGGAGGGPSKEIWLEEMAKRSDIYPDLTKADVEAYENSTDGDGDGKVGAKWTKFKTACAGMLWVEADTAVCERGCRMCSKGCAGWVGDAAIVKGNAKYPQYEAYKGKSAKHCANKCCPLQAEFFEEECPNGGYTDSGDEAVCVAKCHDVDPVAFIGLPKIYKDLPLSVQVLLVVLFVALLILSIAVIYAIKIKGAAATLPQWYAAATLPRF